MSCISSVEMNRLSVHSSVRNQLDISDNVVFKSDFDYFELINAINTMISVRNNVKGVYHSLYTPIIL